MHKNFKKFNTETLTDSAVRLNGPRSVAGRAANFNEDEFFELAFRLLQVIRVPLDPGGESRDLEHPPDAGELRVVPGHDEAVRRHAVRTDATRANLGFETFEGALHALVEALPALLDRAVPTPGLVREKILWVVKQIDVQGLQTAALDGHRDPVHQKGWVDAKQEGVILISTIKCHSISNLQDNLRSDVLNSPTYLLKLKVAFHIPF